MIFVQNEVKEQEHKVVVCFPVKREQFESAKIAIFHETLRSLGLDYVGAHGYGKSKMIVEVNAVSGEVVLSLHKLFPESQGLTLTLSK